MYSPPALTRVVAVHPGPFTGVHHARRGGIPWHGGARIAPREGRASVAQHEKGTPTDVLRAASAADLPQIACIEAAVFPEPLGLPALEQLWRAPSTRYLVAERAGAVCAYFGFQVLGPVAHVISNATHPDHRRRGLASRVLREGEHVAAAAGARWFLGEVRTSNAPQMRLLRRLGYREVGHCKHFFGNGEGAYVVMRFFDDPPPGSA